MGPQMSYCKLCGLFAADKANHTIENNGTFPKPNKKVGFHLSRDEIARQQLKIWFSCKKGFCRRKNRARAAPVSSQPGRFICKTCFERISAA
jgi:hypothetical protein